jgi:hypothetical protein
MGLFDYFTQEGKLKRHARRMSDRDAMPEDREASAHWLAEEGSRAAIAGLLRRFDMSLTQQMKDRTEKELVYRLLLQLGDDVVEPTHTWLKRCKQYAWPLKLLVELEGEAPVVKTVYDVLDGPVGKAAFEPERRRELLVWLGERRDPGVFEHVPRFLSDFDEDVRYAAAEVLIAQEDDAAREPLLAVLADPDEESIRLKHRIAGVFEKRAWRVGEASLEGVLPPDYAVQDGRIASVRR